MMENEHNVEKMNCDNIDTPCNYDTVQNKSKDFEPRHYQ